MFHIIKMNLDEKLIKKCMKKFFNKEHSLKHKPVMIVHSLEKNNRMFTSIL